MKPIIAAMIILITCLSAQELTFSKTLEYINATDYNDSVKQEMRQMLAVTKKVTLNADAQNLMEGLQGLRLTDCLMKHTQPKHFLKFQQSVQEEIKSEGFEDDYKHGMKNAIGWWLTTVALKIKTEGSDPQQFKDFFSCNSTLKIPVPENVGAISKPKAPVLKKYDDPVINFYLDEYKKAYAGFLNAENMVDIFRYDVEADLALNCIRRQIRLNGNDQWIGEGSQIRKAIRHQLTPSSQLRKAARQNEDHMGRNFYLYDLNMVNHLQDEITGLWGKSSTGRCSDKSSATQLYDIFLPKYVDKYTEDLSSSRTHPTKELKNHYVKREKWLKEITQTCRACRPYQTFEKRLTSKKEEAEKRLFRMAKKLERDAGFYSLIQTDKADINAVDSEGKTPLFYAAKSNKPYLLNKFLKAGADIGHKDNFGKTVFDYFDDDVPYEIRSILWTEKYKRKHPGFKEKKIRRLAGNKFIMTTESYINKESWTALMHAVYENNVEKVDALLKTDIDLDDYNNNKVTALHFAVYLNNLPIMKKLLEKGANPNVKNRHGATPLIYAIDRENKEAFELLFQYGADINYVDKYKETPLFYAYQHGKFDMIDLLIKHGVDINQRDSRGATLLYIAFFRNRFNEVKFFLERGADIEYGSSKPIYDSISPKTSEDIVKLVQIAYLKSHSDEKAPVDFVVRYLNEKEARKPSLLKKAVIDGDSEKLAVLLERGREKISIAEKNALLFTAIDNQNEGALGVLLDHGADINARNHSNWTPIRYALAFQCDESIMMLIDKGADFKTMVYSGTTPIHAAATRIKEKKLLKYLLEKGADVNRREPRSGRTPLMSAVASCYYPATAQGVKLLLDYNADISIRDDKGLDVFDITEKECRHKRKETLLTLLNEHKQHLAERAK